MSVKLRPALQFSEGRSKPWSGAKLVNCYAERADGDKRDDFALMAIPGLREFADLGSPPIRGAHRMGELLYAVCGSSLYQIDQDGGVTFLIGGIAGDELVRIADNGEQLAIAAHGLALIWTGATLTTPVDMPPVSDVTFIDGYFLWTVPNSDQFTITGLNDGTSYDPLDVATAEGAPDPLVGVIADHREVQLYGTQTIEIWYNSGDVDFPFSRQGNAFIERGCFDRDSIAKIDNSVQFVGDDRIVYRLDGYSPLRISTHAIEYQLRNATWAKAFVYSQEGHKFYVLMTDVGTYAYDMATGAWHERRSWQRDNWRPNGAVSIWNKTILTDSVTGKLWELDFDTYDEDGDPINVEVYLPTIEAGDRSRVTMYSFELLAETGVGLSTGQGSDPQVALSYSDDGGRLWSNEVWRSLGSIGTYRTRAIWRKLGQFRQRQIRLSITDPVRRFVLGYFADIR